MKKNNQTYSNRLKHIVDAIDIIDNIAGKISKEEFFENITVSSAVCYQFLIIGEAIAALPSEITEKYTYPWYKPKSFRNFLAHEYFGVDLNLVFDTIRIDLPNLKVLLKTIISDLK